MDEIERYARLLGMKPHREVLEVREVEGGHAVRKHDGHWTLVRDDGVLVFDVSAPPTVIEADDASEAMLRGFHGEPEDEPAAKPAPPKRRGRA